MKGTCEPYGRMRIAVGTREAQHASLCGNVSKSSPSAFFEIYGLSAMPNSTESSGRNTDLLPHQFRAIASLRGTHCHCSCCCCDQTRTTKVLLMALSRPLKGSRYECYCYCNKGYSSVPDMYRGLSRSQSTRHSNNLLSAHFRKQKISRTQ